MRVTSWNCSRGAKTDGSMALLAPLRADLVALQECRRPAAEDASVIWRGADPRQGAAVVSTSPALPIEAIEIPSLHPTVVPVVVQAPEPFVFVGVWTHPPYNPVAWKAMTACVAAAVLEGRIDPGTVDLDMPGGRLRVVWDGPGHELILRGPAATVFEGAWPSTNSAEAL